MTNDERQWRESGLIATIRSKLPDFAKACAEETELSCSIKTPSLPIAKRANTCSSAWRSSTQAYLAKKCA